MFSFQISWVDNNYIFKKLDLCGIKTYVKPFYKMYFNHKFKKITPFLPLVLKALPDHSI